VIRKETALPSFQEAGMGAVRRTLFSILVGFLILGPAARPMAAMAQTRALPTAPAADRASQGGLSEAPASLPKVRGASPLEPYLITWLLPVSGILVAAICLGTDRRLRAKGVRL
jgi:hypothetical protein